MNLAPVTIPPPLRPDPTARTDWTDPLRDALVDSRERWRDLVRMSADFAFETNADGRFTFLWPDAIAGWTVEELLGQPASLLTPDGEEAGIDPFRPSRPLRDRRAFIRRRDGVLLWMAFSVVPMIGPDGAPAGVRGLARDVTSAGEAPAVLAAALRRSELIDHIAWQMRSEVLAPRMMGKALQALSEALGAAGAMVVSTAEGVLHATGIDAPLLAREAAEQLGQGISAPILLRGPQGHQAVLLATPTRYDEAVGLVMFRAPGRGWTAEDVTLLEAGAPSIRVALEQGAIQREMSRLAGTDPLTGLTNRRAFIEDLDRRLRRLEQEGAHGCLLFVDLDGMKRINDVHGHEAGDMRLRAVAALLREAVRPTDLIARLGGDEFALWLDGMDALAAAERAAFLCRGGDRPDAGLTMSVGVAARWPGSLLDGPTLLRRADRAMYLAKQRGGGRWHVWCEADGEV